MRKLVYTSDATWKLAQKLNKALEEANQGQWTMADTLSYALASGITMSLEGAEDLSLEGMK